jgi:hypothetical protein
MYTGEKLGSGSGDTYLGKRKEKKSFSGLG